MKLCEIMSYSYQKMRIQSLREIIRTTVTTSKIKATPHFNYKGKKKRLFFLVLVAENSLTA